MSKLPLLLRWLIWVILVQFLLLNLSAAFYAHSFTSFETGRPVPSSTNIFARTWHLFKGPTVYAAEETIKPAFTFQDIRLQSADGIRFSGWLSAGDTTRPCILFLHGYSSSRSFVLAEATALQKIGYPVFLINYRGHGNSSSRSTSMGMEETSEVEQAFTFLRSKGYSKVVIYGVSLGAVIALKAASEGRVKPLAIVADMPFASLHQHLRSRMQMLGFPGEPFGSLVTFWEGVEHGYNGLGHQTTKYASGVHCPVLLEWGDKDSYVRREETEAILKSLPAKEKKLVVYPDANHESFRMADSVKWCNEVGGFFRGLKY
jgi:esterase/lipase